MLAHGVRLGRAARLVRPRAAPAALARDARPVRAAGQRGDAPADAGGAGRPVLRGVPRAVPRRRPRWRRRRPRDVLAAWSGLGYNRRALALQAAARSSPSAAGPTTSTELPGVGPYTAAAVGSFAWDRQEAAVDTNVRRVVERFDGVARAPGGARRAGVRLVPAGRAADVQPGDDGARRHRLPPARAALRRLPRPPRLRRAMPPAARRPPRAAVAPSGSRTPIAGRADASSPRWSPASRRDGRRRADPRRPRARRPDRPRRGRRRGDCRASRGPVRDYPEQRGSRRDRAPRLPGRPARLRPGRRGRASAPGRRRDGVAARGSAAVRARRCRPAPPSRCARFSRPLRPAPPSCAPRRAARPARTSRACRRPPAACSRGSTSSRAS